MFRWRFKEIEDTTSTYGYITKSLRIQFGIEKTHYNDAVVIAGGTPDKKRATPPSYTQARRNNRSLQRFHDIKMIGIRIGEKVSGAALDCGRRTRNTEKWRKHESVS